MLDRPKGGKQRRDWRQGSAAAPLPGPPEYQKWSHSPSTLCQGGSREGWEGGPCPGLRGSCQVTGSCASRRICSFLDFPNNLSPGLSLNRDPLSHSGRALRQITLSKRPVFLSTAGLSPPRVTRASSSLAWEPHAEPSTPRVLGAESPQWRCLRGWELRAVLSPGSNSPQTLSDKARYADDACLGVRGPLGLSQPCDSLRLEPCFASSPGSPSPASPDP